MDSIHFDSLNNLGLTACGSTELRRTHPNLGGLVQTELLMPLQGFVRAPAVDSPLANLLYNGTTPDELMMVAFAPPIANPAILQSPKFAATLRAAQASLADIAAQTQDSDRAVFRDALSVLDQALCDRVLVDNACRALMRG
ncbi:hypothetical protein IE4803_PB00155 (plasmid) [Rhizobium etli bv. phaseoli str. IE4803]|nr:hypothetical protein IE4803_PB00155 [Rhizobium etli bv. phaseoli str. IE4803]